MDLFSGLIKVEIFIENYWEFYCEFSLLDKSLRRIISKRALRPTSRALFKSASFPELWNSPMEYRKAPHNTSLSVEKTRNT